MARKASCEARATTLSPASRARAAVASHFAASPAGVASESSTSSVGAVRSRHARAPGPTYSSSATWKLLPPKPKLDTDARRGCDASRIHGRLCVLR